MSIILNIENDVIPYVDVDQDLSLPSIQPDINDKETTVLVPLLGDTLYTDIETKYNANTSLSSPEEELLKLAQKVVVNLAMSEAIDSLTLSVNDNAITVGESNREKQPFRYQVENFRKQCLRRGYGAIEDLLKFLSENTAVFPSWDETEVSNSTRQFFINSALDFQQYEDIKANRTTFEALKPLMRDVENIALVQVLGETFMQELKTAVKDETIAGAELNLLVKFIRPALAKLVIADACDSLTVEIKGNGIVVNQVAGDESQSTATEPLIDRKRIFAKRLGEYYLNKTREYLNATATELLFATYFNSTLYVAPLTEEDAKPKNIYRA
jgi:hypothetical protein